MRHLVGVGLTGTPGVVALACALGCAPGCGDNVRSGAPSDAGPGDAIATADAAVADAAVADAAVDAPVEVAGITVFPTSGLVVSELGDTDTFEIVLDGPPTADVTLTLASSDATEGSVAPPAVTFTPATWNLSQTVTVTGVQDAIADGDRAFSIITNPATSADLAYALVDAADVSVINLDDDSAAVLVRARRRLFVTEDQGQATFRVRLTTQPAADVVCTLASSAPAEGTVAPTALTFTPANFAMNQVVTVVGVDDAVVDGDRLFAIVLAPCTSADPAYDGYDPRDVPVTNRDND